MTHPRYYDVQQAITDVVGNRLDASELERLVPAALRAAEGKPHPDYTAWLADGEIYAGDEDGAVQR